MEGQGLMPEGAPSDRELLVRLDERSMNMDKRLAKLEGNQRWVVILILGAILTGLMSFILKGGLNVIPPG